jgi:hypothetical protein
MSHRVACSVAVALAAGCVTPRSHVGAWESAGQGSFVRVVLNADQTCVLVAGGVLGGVREGIGGRCHYSGTNDTLVIAKVGEIDGSGPMETLDPPVTLRYERGSDRLFMATGQPAVLLRVQK